MEGVRVGIVGDFDAGYEIHHTSDRALAQLGLRPQWVASGEVSAQRPEERLTGYAGLLIAPASRPYQSIAGVHAAIRFARERGVPLVGTWGGFQHAIVEFARNVLGLEDADHAGTNPQAEHLVVTPLSCSLVGIEQPVTVIPGTRAAALYGAETALEDYRCNYGVNPAYHEALEQAGLTLSGLGENGELRIVELPAHPFFVATLFLPQMRSTPRRPHPILAGFAAVARRTASEN